MARKQGITQWSYSRWNAYDQCPKQLFYKVLYRTPGGAKLDDPPGPAAERGTEIHDLAEKYVRGDLSTLPDELHHFEDDFLLTRAAFAQGRVLVEEQWPFDRRWKLLKDWYDPQVWTRIKLDHCYFSVDPGEHGYWAKAVDYKTGRYRPGTYDDQLSLYATAVLQLFPKIGEVHAEVWMLDSGEMEGTTYRRAALEPNKKKWEARAKQMREEREWAPTPGRHCSWCLAGPKKADICPAAQR